MGRGARTADVVVIGAGVAGLHASALLAGRGLRVILLEARQRVGGRLFTVHEPGWPPFEAGAEFVHGKPPLLDRLLRQARLSPIELHARHVLRTRQGLQRADRLFARSGELLEHLPHAGRDRSFDRLRTEPWWRRLAGPDVQRMTRAFVEGFNAAPAGDISVVALAEQAEASAEVEGDRLFHVRGGYGGLVESLLARAARAGVTVRTGAGVRRIVWRTGQVEVHARGALDRRLPVVTARAALITLPLGVLQARPPAPGAVRFAPELPAAKRQAIRRTRVGAVVRVILRFASPDGGHWSAPGVPDFNFLHLDAAPFPTLWRTTDAGRPPVVTAWAGGPPALALHDQPDEARVRAAVTSLARGLGVPPAALLDDLAGWRIFDWQSDPFARGAYSFAPPGGPHLPGQLRASVEETLYFAGEATHEGGHGGTVHGALETAAQAARELARQL
jgi:monoamine oxidase